MVKHEGPQFLTSTVVKLCEISVANDSGWRDIDDARVQELEAVILDGSYGATSLAGPSLLAEDGKPMHSTTDGGYILNNGKQIAHALQHIFAKVASVSEAERDDAAWLNTALRRVFDEGLRMDIFQYPGPYDRLTHQTVQALAHESDQNKLYNTTLMDKARLVCAYFGREGRDWGKARDAIVQVLGQQKMSTISRWCILAKDFSHDVLTHIARQRDIPQSFIVGNRFLVGKGEESRFKMADTWAKIAFDWYINQRDTGRTISSDEFVTEFCAPAKHAETWERAQRKIYGVVATGFKAFQRVVDKLRTEQARRSILAWLNDKELRKQPHFGLDELLVVVREMDNMKAGTNKSEPSAGVTASTTVPTGTPALAIADSEAALPDDDDVLMVDDPAPPEPEDPVLAKAQSLADNEMMHVSVHTAEDAWCAEVFDTICLC